MKLLYIYLKRYWKLVFVALGLATINQCFSLLDPYVTGHLVDEVINKHALLDKNNFMRLAMFWIGCSIGVTMVSRVAKNFQDYVVNVIVQKLGAQVYADGLKHSLELPYSTFEDQRSGETLNILQKVRVDSERLISALVNTMFTSAVGLIFVIIYSWSISWKVSVIYFTAAPIIAILSSALSKKIKKIQFKIVAQTASLSGSTTESLRNIELIKSLGLSKQEIERLNQTTFKILGLELAKVKYIRSMNFLQGTTVQFTRSIMVFVLLLLIFNNTITPGQYFTFLFYSFFIFNPLQEMGGIIIIYREAEISLNNFEILMNTPIEAKPLHPKELINLDTFEFDNVSFKHNTARTNALSNISFKVNKGETIAFVGPSGSGKSTLVKLLVGLYKPNQGQILYDNIKGDDLNLDQLREKIGFVTQETQLFAGTIRENLLFVKPNATDAEITEVLKKASCEKLLARADNGLDSLIGEGGVKVSGGEKQRLSIARALLRNPSLLVFDEATSSLDSLTEQDITNTIKEINLQAKAITILIAHRLSTVMHANRILVLEHGKIIESGSHEQLLNEKGLYYAMWRQQIGERKHEKNA
ncbi:MAG: ABC transporter ATP-binding protein [Bacteroidia bacterium]|nr:ABC transporter ATP-binding protein [Bacteroidia bacterium]